MSQTISSSPGSSRTGQSTSLILRACDMCRKKKIRCEASSEACIQCVKYKTQCHFTPISVKRKIKRPVKDKHEELEKRLEWIEDQLKRAIKSKQRETYEESRNGLIGASFAIVPDSQMAISPWKFVSVNNVFTRRVFKALPPKDEALHLIERSFQGFNSVFPLFDQLSFMHTFESTNTDINDPGWWACLNVVLALTHRFQSTKSLEKEEADREAWGYFQNALAVSTQLVTTHSTLLAVQALLGMSIVMQGTPNPAPVSLLTSSAIKVAQGMNLHRQHQQPGLSAAEIEQRKRVFWIAYCFDKEISLRTGQPPTQDDEEMDVELPCETDGTLVRPGRLDHAGLFHFRVRLAMIQGQIYKRLCSVKAAKQSVTERTKAVKELEIILERWRTSGPLDLKQDYDRPTSDVAALHPAMHSIILRLAYLNSLNTIHRSSVVVPMDSEIQASDDPGQLRIMLARITRVAEARKTIKLLHTTPQEGSPCIWVILHSFVSAATILLTYILSNPSDPSAPADFELIGPLLRLLGMLAERGESDKVSEMYQSCLELFNRARMVVESRDLHGTSGQFGGRESVEDFIRRIEGISTGYDVNPA